MDQPQPPPRPLADLDTREFVERLLAAGRALHGEPDPELGPCQRDAFLHNVVAHPLLWIWPRLGRWVHRRTPPLAHSRREQLRLALRARLDDARERDHQRGRSRWWDPGRCR